MPQVQRAQRCVDTAVGALSTRGCALAIQMAFRQIKVHVAQIHDASRVGLAEGHLSAIGCPLSCTTAINSCSPSLPLVLHSHVAHRCVAVQPPSPPALPLVSSLVPSRAAPLLCRRLPPWPRCPAPTSPSQPTQLSSLNARVRAPHRPSAPSLSLHTAPVHPPPLSPFSPLTPAPCPRLLCPPLPSLPPSPSPTPPHPRLSLCAGIWTRVWC